MVFNELELFSCVCPEVQGLRDYKKAVYINVNEYLSDRNITKKQAFLEVP
jgi:hypothetical protein